MSLALYFITGTFISAALCCAFGTWICMARRGANPAGEYAGLFAFSAAVGMALTVVVIPWFLLFAVATFLTLAIWHLFHWRTSWLGVVLIVAGIAIHSIPATMACNAFATHQGLISQYPMEDMETRIREPKIRWANRAAKDDPIEAGLRRVEIKVNRESEDNHRAYYLKQLHEDGVQTFIRAAGVSVFRMGRADENQLRSKLRDGKPVDQPSVYPPSADSEMDNATELAEESRMGLGNLHYSSIAEFANVRGFGLIKSRKEVAGFQPHHFSKLTEGSGFSIQTIELVGLLMHDAPVVYVSNKLPSMASSRTAPTRPLSDFETRSLDAIQRGEDLYIRESPAGVRMLGAIRSVEQCVKCHGGERGDLLGAFSYSLVHQFKHERK